MCNQQNFSCKKKKKWIRNSEYFLIFLISCPSKTLDACPQIDEIGLLNCQLTWFVLWNINPCYTELFPQKYMCGELLGWCPSLTALSAAQWLDCSCQPEPLRIDFWSEGKWCDMKRKVMQGTWLTGQTLVSSKKQWSNREMQFKNLLYWGGKSYR